MTLSNKKIDMACKFYDQNGQGGKGPSPKYTQNGKGEGSASKFKMASDGKGQVYANADTSGSFKAKYKQAAGKTNSKMINATVKEDQKGKGSLKSTGKNMGEKMMLGKEGNNRA